MPPRDEQQLPEGTDQIINGAMETGAGAGASTGSGFGTGTSDSFGSSTGTGTGTTGSSGFIGAGGAGDDTGGFAGASTGGSGSDLGGGGSSSGFSSGIGGGSDFGGGSSGGLTSTGGGSGLGGSGDSFGGGFETSEGAGAKDQLKSGVQGLKSQATDKVRSYASDGKARATTALDDLSQLVNETAQTIDDRLGAQYGDYARKAATAVSGFADTVRSKDVDELFDDAREIVRKSPGIAIGAAAVIGFSLVRLLKAGMPDPQQKDVSFQADPSMTSLETGSTTGSASQAPYVAPTTGV